MQKVIQNLKSKKTNMENSTNPIETSRSETVDIMESVLFTNIIGSNVGKSKPKDMLPLIGFMKANINFSLSGINKMIYYSQVKTELKKMITCN